MRGLAMFDAVTGWALARWALGASLAAAAFIAILGQIGRGALAG